MKIKILTEALFAINEAIYKRGDYTIEYKNQTVRLRNRKTRMPIGDNEFLNYTSFKNEDGERFESFDEFVLELANVIGLGLDSGSSPITPITPVVPIAQVLEYSARLFQSGTNNISAQTPQINTINQGENTDDNYRKITFGRESVGTYKVSVLYKTPNFVNPNKVGIAFSDGNIRIISSENGSAGALFSKSFTFTTYTPDGILSDGQLAGGNGTSINIKIYN